MAHSSVLVALRLVALAILSLSLLLLFGESSQGAQSALVAAPRVAPPGAFIVNSTGDAGDSNPGNGFCRTSSPGECTLRAAVEESNAHSGNDNIAFDITGGGVHTISTGGYAITDPAVIDGTTQPGFGGTPLIELDGTSAPCGAQPVGLSLTAGSSTIRGLAINRFCWGEVRLYLNGGNVIEGNFLGTDPTGTGRYNYPYRGVVIETSNNRIGGTSPGSRNIISSHGNAGIYIASGAKFQSGAGKLHRNGYHGNGGALERNRS